jgi:hypothetical protein
MLWFLAVQSEPQNWEGSLTVELRCNAVNVGASPALSTMIHVVFFVLFLRGCCPKKAASFFLKIPWHEIYIINYTFFYCCGLRSIVSLVHKY